MTHYHNIFLCFLIAVLAAGCSNYVRIHGTVVFDDDGTPLTRGSVILESATHSARGELQQDGSFRMSSIKLNDGLPPGVYQVFITGALRMPDAEPGQDPDLPMDQRRRGDAVILNPIPLIGAKYTSAQTSGITFDTSQSRELHIRVTRPDR
jgi:hypothetical protein